MSDLDNDIEEMDPFEHYDVVHNQRGDHSIWPSVKPLPSGWQTLGMRGNQQECLDWIERNWAGPSLR